MKKIILLMIVSMFLIGCVPIEDTSQQVPTAPTLPPVDSTNQPLPGEDVDTTIVIEEDTDLEGIAYNCKWTVKGTVGHWGHIHTRTNQYDAALTVKAIDGAWKITKLDVFSELL